ncbi:MAG: cytochrome c oxidase subunit 2A [Acidimicrobiia bacterium]|jgi:hypothetical protein|nr:cytochrome c oxidase subunit 2A [Acidimicrobiia bacterium]MBT8193064.1 cytochrome c oxidase subunit 2A [Acidimicrobiia bacterium]MBT8246463.1 cytochrome c oxidase subunit 2A [Acidimicrobiia bacterium]
MTEEGVPIGTDEEFKPRGTVAIVALFTATLVLLWLSIYLILIARGVTT